CSGVVGDVDVGPAVVVVVEDERREAEGRPGGQQARLLGHVAEGAIAVAAKQHVLGAGEAMRAAHHAEALPEAVAAASSRVASRVSVRDVGCRDRSRGMPLRYSSAGWRATSRSDA